MWKMRKGEIPGKMLPNHESKAAMVFTRAMAGKWDKAWTKSGGLYIAHDDYS